MGQLLEAGGRILFLSEDPALIWFRTEPASDEIRKRYLGHRVTFGRGAPWMRVRHS